MNFMLYLYFGFLFAQSFSVAQVIYNANIPLLTIVFSIIVFLIWSFFPLLGYGVARTFGARLECSKYLLVFIGICISVVEQLLFHFEVLTTIDGYYTMLVTASLFFAAAFLPVSKISSIFNSLKSID
jgi:hypothetical protein